MNLNRTRYALWWLIAAELHNRAQSCGTAEQASMQAMSGCDRAHIHGIVVCGSKKLCLPITGIIGAIGAEGTHQLRRNGACSLQILRQTDGTNGISCAFLKCADEPTITLGKQNSVCPA